MEDESKFMPLLFGRGVRGSGSIEPGITGQAIWLVTLGKTGGGHWYGETWLGWRLLQPGKSERLEKPGGGVKSKSSLLRTLPCST